LCYTTEKSGAVEWNFFSAKLPSELNVYQSLLADQSYFCTVLSQNSLVVSALNHSLNDNLPCLIDGEVCVTPGPIWMAHEWPMSAGARV
jgi:hypothetical protein